MAEEDEKRAKELRTVGELINAIGLHASVLENPRYREMIVAYVRLFEKEASANSPPAATAAPAHAARSIRIVRVQGKDLRFPLVAELRPGMTIDVLADDVLRAAGGGTRLDGRAVLERISDGKRVEWGEDLRDGDDYAIQDY